jgi:hypothetical protein
MNPDDDASVDPRDDVAALIRLAGRRPAVPEEVAARVRAAAREHWRHGVRRRARVRYLWTGAVAATAASAAVAIALSVFRRDTAAPLVAQASIRVESVVGSAWIRDGREGAAPPRALQVGAGVAIRSEIETGDGGRVAVRLPSGHSVRLDSASRIRILGRKTVALDRGALYADSGRQAPPAPLSIRTPLGDIRETGTQFEVRLGAGSVRIRVREGSVVLRAADRVHRVDASTELEADGRGSSTTRTISTYGPEWDWIAGITPMPELEGLTARAFLDWVAREGGWTLHLADEEAARRAAQTVLRGSVDGLTLDQALDAVLPTCGMVHRIDDGRLIVDRSAT